MIMQKSHEHIVTSFDEELKQLDQRIAKMGGLAENLLANAFEALERRDSSLAEAAIARDKAIDESERELEEQVIAMIALRQPMAVDLRQIMAALKVSSDLERVGDLSKNIAKRALATAGEPYPPTLMSGLRHMKELAQSQLKDVLDAYVERDTAKAREIWERDADLDAMYNSVFRELLTYMMEDPRNIGLCTHLLFGAKNLERIGDHCTNIAETVFYIVKGVIMEDERPKSDKTSTTLIETKP